MTALADGTAIITIDYKGVSVSINILVAQTPSHNYSAIIVGDDTIYKSRTKTYSCSFYDNDQEVPLSGIFSVTDTNGKPTTMATIISQGYNNCVLRGDSIGSVMLIVTDTTGSVSTSKKIQIKSAL